MASGTSASEAIAARFGADVLDSGGAVDRRKLAPLVFADPAARRDLEAIVHPAVYRAIEAGVRAFELIGSTPLAVVAVPLLYETGHAADFARVVATTCAPEVQLARLRDRGLAEGEARQRVAAQMSAAEKAARADFVIRTDGTFAETDEQVDRLIRLLLQ
jgi:dephospho-CoA kinase